MPTFAVGISSVEEINKFNILNATMLSMKRALKKIKKKAIPNFNRRYISPKRT